MVRNRGRVLASFIAVVFALVAGVIATPSSAHAIFVPTANDDLAYVRSYAVGTASYPQAIAVSPFGDIYYTHSDYHMWDEVTYDNRVFGITADGFEFLNVGAADYSEFQWPDGLALTESGNLVVADTSDTGEIDHNRLRIFDAYDGTFVRNIGGFGTGPLGFDKPYGVTIGDDGTLYVADTGNNRIQMVSESGSYIGSWAMPTGSGVNPNGMDFDPDGHLWVAMEGSNRVCEFTTDGTLLRTITAWDETDSQGNVLSSESLYGPMDVAVDAYGVVYICDTNNSRIVRFDDEGTWLGTFNGYDTPEASFSYPTDIDVDAFGNLYVADAVNDAIYKFHFVMADPDEVPPVTTSNIDEDWQQGPVGITLTAEDASLTVEATLYSTDGAEPDTLYTGPFTISDEGTTTVKYFSVDRAENYEQIQTKMVRVDNTTPVTTADYEPISWALSTYVGLNATDALSGVYNTLYIVDNGTPLYYNGVPFQIFGTGSHTVDFYSFDNAGNAETFQRINLVLEAPDTTAPITSSNIPSGWINTSHSIEVTGTDAGGSGIDRTYFSTDGSTPTSDYPGPVLVTAEGIRTVKYYSTDRAGNVEALKTTQLKIDKTPPTSSSNGVESYVDSATVNFQASDALSGIQDFVYRLDNGDWTRAYSMSTSAWGTHKLTWYATDQAGNQQTQQTLNFTILQPDNEPPITGDDIPSSWIKGPVSVSFNAHDVVSSVEGTYYSLDGSFPTVLYTGPFNVNTEGSHTVKFYSVDTRGNAETVQTKLLRIDNTPPVSSTNAQGSYLGTAQITLSASDSLSAVASMRYRLDGGSWIVAMPGDKVTTSIVGEHVLEYYAIDTPSNAETPKSTTFTVTPPDSDPPVSTMTAPSNWVRGPAAVTLSATDALSSVTGIYYSLTGAPSPLSLYSLPLSISAEGTTTITYRAVDFWGNWELTKTGYVKVDNTAPITTTDASLNYVDQATVNLTASDALSGVNRTYYKVDSGAWQQGTSVYVTGYSYHTIQYYSVDNAGNTEGVKSTVFRINRADRYYDEDDSLLLYRGSWSDHYGVATNATTDTDSDMVVYFQGDRFWYIAYVGPDAGIAQVSIDGGPWTNVDLYNQNVKSGQYVWYSGDLNYDFHMVRVRPSGLKNPLSTDTYVNVDQIRVQGFVDEVPDTEAPTTTSDINENWQRGPVSVSLSAVDTTTGVAATYYSTDGGTPDDLYSGAFTINTDGQNIIKYYSIDKRGNTEPITTQYVRVDNTAPVTTSAAINGFISAGTVALTPTDTNGSGVSATYWRLDGGDWNTGVSATIPYVVGNHLLEWYSVDAVGNSETVKSASVPVYARNEQTAANLRFTNTWFTGTSSSYSSGSYTYTINNGFTDVAFTGTGIRWITSKGQAFGIARVTLDDNAPVLVDLYRGTNSHKQVVWTASGLSDNEVHRLRIEWTGTKNPAATSNYVGVDAIDVVGALVPVDLEAPVTNAFAPASWTKSPALVVLNPTDAVSGVVETTYVLDGGTPTPYTEPLSLTGDGVHTVDYRSVDARGNTETTKTATILIDDTVPTSSSDVADGWLHGTVTVTLSGEDAHSGIESIRYRLDGGALTEYAGPFDISGDELHELRFYATDNAGNVETEHVQTVRIDDTDPSTVSDISEEWQQGPVLVSLESTDTLSGVESTLYRIDGGSAQTYDAPFEVSGDGTHTVEFHSVDNAGNAMTPVVKYVRIDNTAPAVVSDIDESWQHGPVTVSLASSDSLSGLSETRYSIDGAAAQLYSGDFTIAGDGVHDVEFWAVDNAGNAMTPVTQNVRIDDTAPLTGSSVLAEYVDAATIQLVPTDTGSGVAATYYCVDAGEWVSGTSISVEEPGHHEVEFASVDALGNAEATQTASFQVLDRFEQDAEMIRTTGTWYTGTSISHSGDSYTYSAFEGSRIDVAFVGTQVDIKAMTGTIFGIAAVSIDGQEPVDVDLYSSPNRFKQTVFSAADLAYGLHTVSIEWTGRRNDASTNSYVNLDAIDVDGALVAVDLEAPVTTSDVPGVWVNEPVTVSLASTDTVAGVEATFIQIGEGAPAPYSDPVTVSAEGETVASFFSIDARGNRETTKTASIRIDYTAPATTADITPDWQQGPVEVSLTADDALSGVSTTYYRVDGGEELAYVAPFEIAGDGEHTVAFYSVDAAGNSEAPNTSTVRVDNTAPNSTSDADSSWHKGSAVISLSATDTLSDIASIDYRVDTGDALAYTGPISVSGDGTHTVSFWATDAAGNVETANTVDVYVDGTAPATTSDATSEWQKGPVSITLGATDELAGVAATYYSVDGAQPAQYAAPFEVSGDGEHSIAFTSVDAVGNVETTQTAVVRIDNLAPVTSTDAPSSPIYSNTTVRFSATDAHSGVDSTEVRVNGGAWTTTDEVTLSEQGRYFIEYRSTDNLGTTEDIKSTTVYYMTRSEQDSSSLRRTGAWYTGTSVSYSGGSYVYGTGASTRIDLAFMGTRVDLVTTMSKISGIARVTVDDGAPVDVDLYSLANRFKVTSFSLADLPYGLHTVKIEWTGTKNPAATNNYVNLDAVDTDGSLVAVDLEAPTTASNAPATWVRGPVNLALTPTDAVSGVASTHLKLGAGEFAEYTAPVIVSTEGVTVASFYSVDSRGNREATKTASIRIDNTAPSTTTGVSSDWQKGPIGVTLNATDALSGISNTYYTLDGGTRQTYTAPFNITSDGVHTLSFFSEDAAGSVEATNTHTVRLDNTAPVTTDNVVATYQETANISLAAADAGSGVATTKWRIDGGTWHESTVASTTAAGVHTLEYYSVDALGNTEATVSKSFGLVKRTDNTNSEIYYLGPWYNLSAGSYYGGSYNYLSQGGSAEFTFTGTRADWVASKGRIFGIAKVTIDGGAPTYVDLYAPSTLYKQTVFSATGLTNARHTIKIEWTGTKNPLATNHYINVDAIDLLGNYAARRTDQTDKMLYYTGAWNSVSHANYHGGSYQYLATEGDLTVTFEGSRAEWVATKGRIFGIAKVTVDGGDPTYVDLYAGSTQYQQTVFSISSLSSGTHTMKIEWTGTKNALASNSYINADAVDLVGRLQGVRYEQSNPLFYFDSNWLNYDSVSFSGGSYQYASRAGAMNLTFDGSRAELIATKGPIFGIAKVTVDGGTPNYVDLYNSSNIYKQSVFSVENLSPGTHVMTVEFTGDKNPSATNNYVNVDALDLVGRPTTGRLEQAAESIYDAGSWYANSSTSFSGGSYGYAFSSASKTLAFDGTYVSLISMKGPIFGNMRITLDGEPVDVDLYAPSNTYRQRIFTASGLANGRHTITVEWTGTKNPLASDAYVNLDAIDLVGATAVYDPLPAPTRYEDTSELITKSGAWMTGTSGSYSGGTYAYATGEASATVAFDGTELSWIGVRGPIFGFATVSVDGGEPMLVDLFSATSVTRDTLWSTGTLSEGLHTVTISFTGDKNELASKNYINLDAVDVQGTLVP